MCQAVNNSSKKFSTFAEKLLEKTTADQEQMRNLMRLYVNSKIQDWIKDLKTENRAIVEREAVNNEGSGTEYKHIDMPEIFQIFRKNYNMDILSRDMQKTPTFTGENLSKLNDKFTEWFEDMFDEYNAQVNKDPQSPASITENKGRREALNMGLSQTDLEDDEVDEN